MKNRFKVFLQMPIVLLLLGVLFTQIVYSQDFAFNNGFGTPLFLNAGYSGASDDNILAFQLKKSAASPSWPGFNHVASYDHFVPKLSGGLGFIWSSEYLEDLWTFSLIKGAYALHLSWKENISFSPFLSLGFGINHLSENYQSAGGSTQGPLNKTYWSVGTGFLFKCHQFTAGIALDHLNRPDIGWDNIPRKMHPKFIVHGTWEHQVDELIVIQPGLIGQWQGDTYKVIPSLELNYQGVIAGFTAVNQRYNGLNTSGLGGLLGVEWSSIRFLYCFNGRIAGDLSYEIPAHEFSLSYRFKRR